MKKTYVVSGYFAEVFQTNGLHSGHIKYIRSVLDLMDETDKLIILVNNICQRQVKYCDIDPGHPMFGSGSDDWLVEKIRGIYPYWNITIKTTKSQNQSVRADLEEIAKTNPSVVFVKDGGEYDLENLPERGIDGVEYLFLDNPKVASAREILTKK